MTNTKEPKPCDMPPKTIYAYKAKDTGSMHLLSEDKKHLPHALRYDLTRADQPPPLPDGTLKHAIEWAEKLVKDCKAVDCDYTHLGDEPIYIPYLDAFIRAATQQPEVVTVDDVLERALSIIKMVCESDTDEDQQPQLILDLMKRDGLKIVEGV